MTLVGITHCDRVRAARKWLVQHSPGYRFIDLKQQQPTAADWLHWLELTGSAVLINRRSTTFRRLFGPGSSALIGNPLNHAEWVRLLQTSPTLMKRPLLLYGKKSFLLGFNPDDYQRVLL